MLIAHPFLVVVECGLTQEAESRTERENEVRQQWEPKSLPASSDDHGVSDLMLPSEVSLAA